MKCSLCNTESYNIIGNLLDHYRTLKHAKQVANSLNSRTLDCNVCNLQLKKKKRIHMAY